jgi:hypothetical protein
MRMVRSRVCKNRGTCRFQDPCRLRVPSSKHELRSLVAATPRRRSTLALRHPNLLLGPGILNPVAFLMVWLASQVRWRTRPVETCVAWDCLATPNDVRLLHSSEMAGRYYDEGREVGGAVGWLISIKCWRESWRRHILSTFNRTRH